MTIILIILLCLVLIFMRLYIDNTLIAISKYEIKNHKIPKAFDKFKIIHLSDFHNYGFKKTNFEIINKVNIEKPDIIVMTGDMVNKYDKNFEKFLSLAKALSEKYEIYYIVGNHELRLENEDLKFIIDKLKKFGIKILKDEKSIIIRNKEHINIYGIDIPLSYYKVLNRPLNIKSVINKALYKCSKKEYNILLVHNPLYFEEYARHNVNLILSGHVHGGMIRLPFIGAILSPERKFFPKYSSGVYKTNNKKLVVSRGLGHSRKGVRLFNRREIISITLHNDSQDN